MHFCDISKVLSFYLLYFLYLASHYHGTSLSTVELACNVSMECEADLSFKKLLPADDSECDVDESLLIGILCQIFGAQQYFDLISDVPSGDNESNFTCEIAMPAITATDPCQEKIDLIQNTLTTVSTEIAKMVRDIIRDPQGFQESICRYLHDVKCLEDAVLELESEFAEEYAALIKEIRENLERYQETLTLIQARIIELETQLTTERLQYLAAWLQSGQPGVFGEFNRLFSRNRQSMLTFLVNSSLYEGRGMPRLTSKYLGYVATFVKTIDNDNDQWLAINQSFYTLAAKRELSSESILVLYQMAIDEFASESWMQKLIEDVARAAQSFLLKWEHALETGNKDTIREITDFANSVADQPVSRKSILTQLPTLISKVAGGQEDQVFKTLFQFCFSFEYEEHKLVCLVTLKQYTSTQFLFPMLLKVIETKNSLLPGSLIITNLTELIKSFPANMRMITGDCVSLSYWLFGDLTCVSHRGNDQNKDYIHRDLSYSTSTEYNNYKWKFEWTEEKTGFEVNGYHVLISNYTFRLRNIDLVNADMKHEYLGTHLNWEESDDGEGYVKLTTNPEAGCWHPKHYYWRVDFLPNSDKINLFHLGMQAYFHIGLTLNLHSVSGGSEWEVSEC